MWLGRVSLPPEEAGLSASTVSWIRPLAQPARNGRNAITTNKRQGFIGLVWVRWKISLAQWGDFLIEVHQFLPRFRTEVCRGAVIPAAQSRASLLNQNTGAFG